MLAAWIAFVVAGVQGAELFQPALTASFLPATAPGGRAVAMPLPPLELPRGAAAGSAPPAAGLRGPAAFSVALCALAVAGAAVRKPVVGGNWKCNGTLESGAALVEALNSGTWDEGAIDVVVCPVALQAPTIAKLAKPSVQVALQNCSATGMGAFTGEMSVEQIKDAGIQWVVIGHSERRSLYGESDEVCAAKLKRALGAGLKVLYCIGEQLPERESGQTNEVCAKQLDAVIALGLKQDQWENIVIAYEPVWAIGTGKVATPQQAQDTHEFIRSHIAAKKSEAVAKKIRIQYGGSVSNENCGELMACPDIDGFLVGGASLKPDFVNIIQTTAAIATATPFLTKTVTTTAA